MRRFRQSIEHRRNSSERMKRLNADPEMQRKQSEGRRVINRHKPFRVPADLEDVYFKSKDSMFKGELLSARETAVFLGILKEERSAQDKN